MPRYGRNPAKGLAARSCEVCAEEFQPYRENTRTCSRRCYGRLPERKAASSEFLKRPDVKARKNAARRVDANPDRRREANLRSSLRSLYGLSFDEYTQMLDEQGNRCAICGDLPDPNGVRASSRLHVDHDHDTGAVRGLLCNRCNQGVGYFRDAASLMRKAAQYIERRKSDS